MMNVRPIPAILAAIAVATALSTAALAIAAWDHDISILCIYSIVVALNYVNAALWIKARLIDPRADTIDPRD
jgi:hypothetical protein